MKIAGNIYGNVSSIDPSIETEYYHNVTSLSGKKYQAIRYTKTNYTVVFFNLLTPTYVNLRNYIKSHKGQAIVCGFPNDNGEFEEKEYFLTITAETNKGFINNKYLKNGLTVLFEAVNAD